MLNVPISQVSAIFTWPGYSEVYNNERPTEDLVKDAKTAIILLKGVNIDAITAKLKADMLLVSMLDHSVDENARRYTASVIITAWKNNFLLQAAEIWFQHLLYPGTLWSLSDSDMFSWCDKNTVQAVGVLRTEINMHLPRTDYEDLGSLILQARQGNQDAFERLVSHFL
jgi:hypothetical protein